MVVFPAAHRIVFDHPNGGIEAIEPYPACRVFRHPKSFITGKTAGIYRSVERITVEAANTEIGGKPHKAATILEHPVHGIAGQTVDGGVLPPREVLGKKVGGMRNEECREKE